MDRIGILGAGTWGAALARLLGNSGKSVVVWAHSSEHTDALINTRIHRNLPDMRFPEHVSFSTEIADACSGADAVVFATPSVFIRQTAELAKPFISDKQIAVSVSKGLEAATLLTMTEVIGSVIGNPQRIVALSGPTHAEEVALDLPTMIVSACKDLNSARRIQELFSTEYLRVYTNSDVLGVELCGALKNVMALAAGISDGLGYGDNAKAALVTRGMVEISRLGSAMGCDSKTFAGLAGIGDLVVTATSRHSRNNRAGFLIGSGLSVSDTMDKIGMVVEGLNALEGALSLSRKFNIEMPIVEAVGKIVINGADPRDIVGRLMGRPHKHE